MSCYGNPLKQFANTCRHVLTAGKTAFMTMRKIFAKCFPRQLNLPKTCNRAIMVMLQFVCLHGRSDERGTQVRESERADINPFCTVYPRVRAIRHSNGRWRVSPQMVRYNLTGHTSTRTHSTSMIFFNINFASGLPFRVFREPQ